MSVLQQVIIPKVTHAWHNPAKVPAQAVIGKRIICVSGIHVHRQPPLFAVADAKRLLSLSLRFARAGNNMLAKMAMIAITTRSSISVKAGRIAASLGLEAEGWEQAITRTKFACVFINLVGLSFEYFVDNMSMHVGQSAIDAIMPVNQLEVVDA